MSDNIVDFPDKAVIEDEAWQWLIKCEGDTPPTKDEIAQLNEWVARSALHKQTLISISKQWNNFDALSELIIPGEVPNRLREGTGSSRIALVLMGLVSPFILLYSALNLLIAGLGVGRAAEKSAYPRMGFASLASITVITCSLIAGGLWIQSSGSQIYATGIGEQSTYNLADGSTLWLNTNSRVQVDYDDTLRRITLHSGEAHFDVYHNPGRPFEVYAGTRMIRAVGTAFSVFIESEEVMVTVTEGKVELGIVDIRSKVQLADNSSVAQAAVNTNKQDQLQNVGHKAPNKSPSKPSAEIVGALSAGQSVVIPAGDQRTIDNIAEIEKTELRRRLAWLEGQLIYAGETLGDVIKEVSRYTPVTIELLDPELADIRIGGQFQVGQTDALFDILELGFGLKVSRLNENHVQVSAQD